MKSVALFFIIILVLVFTVGCVNNSEDMGGNIANNEFERIMEKAGFEVEDETSRVLVKQRFF